MTVLVIGASVRNSKIEGIVASLNEELKAEKLKQLIFDNFSTMTEEEKQDELDGQSEEDYFHNELTELAQYTSESLHNERNDFQVGSTFEIIYGPDEDPAFTFVLNGFASEGVFGCCYIADDAPVIDLSKI